MANTFVYVDRLVWVLLPMLLVMAAARPAW